MILDLSPTKSTALLHEFRPRNRSEEIQPGMRFQGRSPSLPKLMGAKTEIKLRYKGIEELGNNLKSNISDIEA